jgi:hypothetical protein
LLAGCIDASNSVLVTHARSFEVTIKGIGVRGLNFNCLC